MKSLQTICLLFATAGLVAAQQYTISTVAGIPQTPGLFPLPNTQSTLVGVPPALPTPAPAIGPNGGQLYLPSTVAVDPKGNIYIANFYTYVVDMVSASTGQITLIAGIGTPGTGGDDASATLANITDVHGIAFDSSGNVYISDTSTCRIRRIDNPSTNTTPKIATFVGQGSVGSVSTIPFCGNGSTSPFKSPGALAFDSKGNLYVADYGASVVDIVTSAGVVSTFAGNGTYGYSGDGGAASKAMLAYPASLTFDSAGNLYIGDEGNSNIRKVDTNGNITTVASGVSPEGLGIDSAGNFYYVDGVSSSVRKVLPGGGVVTIAGNGQPGYGGDGNFNGTTYAGGQASLASLNQPTSLALGPDGSIYVADTGNEIIRHLVVTPSTIGVQDAASEQPGSALLPGFISPGEILLLFGSGLGPSTLTSAAAGTNGFFPTQFAGTSVTFNGTPAPIIYTSSGLVAVVAPYEITNSGTANIVLDYSPPGTTVIAQFTASMPVAATSPAIFTANATGSGQAAAVNVADGSINSTTHPAKLGSFIELYVTGAGYTTAPMDGQTASVTCGSACLPVPLLPVTVKIANQYVTPSYAGGAPSLIAGVTQINVQIPTNIIPGTTTLVQVLVGGALDGYPSQTGVTIATTQ